jgi:putative tryptophan/tyrosine transport system substrate-binding protein
VKRREFIAVLGGVATWPFFALAQPGRVAKVGILAYGNKPNSPLIEAFRSALRNLGYVEGRNLAVEFRGAADDPSRIDKLAVELVLASVDVIVTDGLPSALAAKKATTVIPIVMAVVFDAVAAGLVTSYARPGGNITGFTILAPELGTKRLELLKEAVPGLKRVAVLTNGANPMNATPQVAALREAARVLGLEIEEGPVRNPGEFASAFEKFKAQEVAAVATIPEAMLFQERQRIVDLALASRLPGMYPDRQFVDAGGLLFYGPLVVDLFKRAAGYVDRILKGAKVGDLPIEQPTRFEFVVNLNTAKALGITIPPPLLARADEVIE